MLICSIFIYFNEMSEKFAACTVLPGNSELFIAVKVNMLSNSQIIIEIKTTILYEKFC